MYDALSYRDVAGSNSDEAAASTGALHALSRLTFAFLDDVRQATVVATDTQTLLQRLQDGELTAPMRLDEGLLLHGSRIFVLDHGDLRHQAILLAHLAGHEAGTKDTSSPSR